MNNRDLKLGLVIGAAVGLLIQPVLSNVNAVIYLSSHLGLPGLVVRAIVFLIFLAGAPFALWLASKIATKIPVVYQIAKFASVGTLNSFIDLGLFNLMGLVWGIPSGGSTIFKVFKTISFFVATTNSFFWNKAWTFGDRQDQGQTGKALKFYIVTGINWLVNLGVANAVSAIRPENASWVSVVAPVCGIFAGMAGNFLGYKFLVFKDNGSKV